jgi:N-acetylglucosaminyldiphosphoundecaprenol N-acetyl-beta-D-mannosaminyltransferase
MSTLICNPSRDCVNSLGIPVDKLTLDSAVNEIIPWHGCATAHAWYPH